MVKFLQTSGGFPNNAWHEYRRTTANRRKDREPIQAASSALHADLEDTATDADNLWALRRKMFKTLSYQERGTPVHRRKLKHQKYAEQNLRDMQRSVAITETKNDRSRSQNPDSRNAGRGCERFTPEVGQCNTS